MPVWFGAARGQIALNEGANDVPIFSVNHRQSTYITNRFKGL